MAEQKKQEQEKNQEKSKRNRILLLLLLLLAFCFTSSIVGYMIGWYSGPRPGGEIIDDIELIPPSSDDEMTVSLSGRVTYEDGLPASAIDIELHSTPRHTVTDADGRFFFHQVENGTHEIFVLDGQGNVLASCKVEIDSDDDALSIKLTQDGEEDYVITLPGDLLVIELDFSLTRKADGTAELTVEEPVTAIGKDGSVVTPAGVTKPETGKTLTTSGGNTVLSDGTVVTPQGEILLNDGTRINNKGEITHPNGEQDILDPSRTAFQNGAKYEPETNTILTPDGFRIDVATGKVTLPGDITDSTTTGTTSNPPQTTTEPPETTTEPPETTTEPPETTTELPETTTEPPETTTEPPETTTEPPETTTEPPETTTEPPETTTTRRIAPGGAYVNSEGIRWTQNTVVNLLAGIDKLSPGVKGSYTFTVSNSRREYIDFFISVTDDNDNPIPFKLTLKDEKGVVTPMDEITLRNRSSKTFTLYWEWPYESGDDAYDTAIGTSDDLIHTVTITVRAESRT